MPVTDQSHFIDLLRHGEPEGGDRFRGTRDDPLSNTGWEQMRSAVKDASPWNLIVSSPLLRCAQFASELAENLHLPMQLESGFQELAFGQWEGRTYRELQETEPEALKAFFRDPLNHLPPGSEPLAECKERVHETWNLLKQRHSGQHILLVAHGAVIRIIYSRIFDMPLQSIFHIEVPYACVSRIRCHTEGDRLVFHCGCLQ